MNIYLIRHGETDNNQNKTYYGSLDSGLNEKGKAQALKVKEKLRDIKFQRIFCSNMKRTIETAEIILEESHVEITEEKRIREMDLGIFEGKGHEELKEMYPKEWETWCNNWKEYKIPDGESYLEFYSRIKEFFLELLNSQYENILIITHSGVIKSIYSYIFGENLDIFWKVSSRNGDITLIKYEYGNLYLDFLIPVESLNI